MNDHELESIREKRMRELQQAVGQQQAIDAGMLHQMEQLEGVVKQKMDREALLRYGNIKAADQERAMGLIAVFGQVLSSGKVPLITDDILKSVLVKFQPGKQDFKLRRV